MPLDGFFASWALRTKKTLVATERRRAKVAKQRDDWFKHRVPAVSAQPERVVFIDETSVKTNLTRQRGWAPRGDRLVMDAPFGSWGTQTFIAGLSAGAMVAPWGIKGAMDGAAFAAYVEKVLVPELAPGTVIRRENDPPDRFLIRLIPRQPRYAQERRRRQSHAKSRMLVPVLAALQPGPEPD